MGQAVFLACRVKLCNNPLRSMVTLQSSTVVAQQCEEKKKKRKRNKETLAMVIYPGRKKDLMMSKDQLHNQLSFPSVLPKWPA